MGARIVRVGFIGPFWYNPSARSEPGLDPQSFLFPILSSSSLRVKVKEGEFLVQAKLARWSQGDLVRAGAGWWRCPAERLP
jgi:hypothetical protein